MSYAVIDGQIVRWADKHALKLVTSSGGSECRAVYVSSMAGECFQIWLYAPRDGRVSICAAGIESRRDDDPPRGWSATVDEVEDALDRALQTVIEWMKPSERHFAR